MTNGVQGCEEERGESRMAAQTSDRSRVEGRIVESSFVTLSTTLSFTAGW